MKRIFISLVLILGSLSLSFSNNDPSKTVILETTDVTVTSETDLDYSFFKSANYNADNEQLEYMTFEDITFIQIFNTAGDLEFQLPVQSTKVLIGKSLFGTGEYKIAFLIDGKSTIHFSTVNFK